MAFKLAKTQTDLPARRIQHPRRRRSRRPCLRPDFANTSFDNAATLPFAQRKRGKGQVCQTSVPAAEAPAIPPGLPLAALALSESNPIPAGHYDRARIDP